MFDASQHRDDLILRLDAIRRILNAGDRSPLDPTAADISRETRGLAILLLFACYEHLVFSLCRGLLETAVSLRVGNRRLRPGFQLFAAYGHLQAIRDSRNKRIWTNSGPRLLECLKQSRSCTVNVDLFPDDGTFMRRSQMTAFCAVFGLGDPAPVLREIWDRLDTIVTQRNGIAHGRQTPEEVGRGYTKSEIDELIDLWQRRWIDFIAHVEKCAGSRAFYRERR